MGTHVLLSRVLEALNSEIDDTEGGHELIGAVMDRLEAEAAAGTGLRGCVRDAPSRLLCATHGELWPSLARRCNGWIDAALAVPPAAPERGLDVERRTWVCEDEHCGLGISGTHSHHTARTRDNVTGAWSPWSDWNTFASISPSAGVDVEREAVIGAAKALVATAASSGSTLPPGELGIGGQMMTGWIRGEPFEPLIDAVYELHRREDGAPPRVYEKQ